MFVIHRKKNFHRARSVDPFIDQNNIILISVNLMRQHFSGQTPVQLPPIECKQALHEHNNAILTNAKRAKCHNNIAAGTLFLFAHCIMHAEIFGDATIAHILFTATDIEYGSQRPYTLQPPPRPSRAISAKHR